MGLDEECINLLRTFDWMTYLAFLHVVYGNDMHIDDLDKYDSAEFTHQLKKWHSKSYLSVDLKIGYIKEYILKQ